MDVEKGKVGEFFLVSGLVLLILFVASDLTGAPQCGLLFWAVLAGGLGLLLIRQNWKDPGPSARFRSFRKLSTRPPKDSKKK